MNPLICNVSLCKEERNWGNLLPELVSKVADLALRSDVTDYIWQRAICKPWGPAAKADPTVTGMDPRCFWEMVDGKLRGEESCRFVNDPSGVRIIHSSVEGCLSNTQFGLGTLNNLHEPWAPSTIYMNHNNTQFGASDGMFSCQS
jgi:hypothetical protein